MRLFGKKRITPPEQEVKTKLKELKEILKQEEERLKQELEARPAPAKKAPTAPSAS